MWVQILFVSVIYGLFKCLFYDDDVSDLETSDFNAIFSVANRLEKLYAGKAYVGLRIPDADTRSRENVDIVLVTKGGAVVISVKNFSGFVSVNGDGSWACEEAKGKERDKVEVHLHPDPVEKVKKQASILESYLEQRGLTLPEGYLSYKVMIPNPKFCGIYSNYIPPEVITYHQWLQLESQHKTSVTGWIKDAFRAAGKEMQESMNQQLNFILSTAPIWDRLELGCDNYVLGEFIEFKGEQEDILALRCIKRSKVSNLIVQNMSMFGSAPSTLQVLYFFRVYGSEGASTSGWNKVRVKSSTEVRFQPANSTKVRKFKLSSILSMSLGA